MMEVTFIFRDSFLANEIIYEKKIEKSSDKVILQANCWTSLRFVHHVYTYVPIIKSLLPLYFINSDRFTSILGNYSQTKTLISSRAIMNG